MLDLVLSPREQIIRLCFGIERAFYTDLNLSASESIVLDFAHGLWTDTKIIVLLIVLCHPLYPLSQTVHLYPFAKLLYRKKRDFFSPFKECLFF